MRYSNGTTPTDYTYTGQHSNVSDFGLMYYGARWYDNSLGRFAQADTDVPASQGVQAYDHYAYVNNNPVKYTDPSGHRIVEGCNERVGGCNITQKIIDDDKHKENEFRQRTEYLQCRTGDVEHCSGFDKVIISLDNLDLGDGTIQIGFSLSGFIPAGLRGDLALAIDFKGNIALLATGGGGGSTAVSGNTGPYLAVTNAPSIDYLKGPNVQIGGQIGEGATVNTEMILFQGSGRTGPRGISISPGFGLIGPWPFELHGTATGTTILASINIPDIIVSPFRP